MSIISEALRQLSINEAEIKKNYFELFIFKSSDDPDISISELKKQIKKNNLKFIDIEEDWKGINCLIQGVKTDADKLVKDVRALGADARIYNADLKYWGIKEDKPIKEAAEDEIEETEDKETQLVEPIPAGPGVEEVSELENDCTLETATAVMAAYQNANKWLDSVKEVVYTNMNCPFFSSFIHTLAHSMPGRFDKFGDILHTVNMEIPYPATEEITQKPQNITEAFDVIFNVLDDIKAALNAFIKCTDEEKHGMACAAETLLNDIESEYPMLFRLQGKWNDCNSDTVDFDKYVMQYVEHKDNLLESLNESWDDELDDNLEIVDSWYLPIAGKPKIRFINDTEDSYYSFIDVIDLRYQVYIRGSLLEKVSDILHDLDQENLEKLFTSKANLQNLCDELTDMSMKYHLTYENVETIVKEFINNLAKNEGLNESTNKYRAYFTSKWSEGDVAAEMEDCYPYLTFSKLDKDDNGYDNYAIDGSKEDIGIFTTYNKDYDDGFAFDISEPIAVNEKYSRKNFDDVEYKREDSAEEVYKQRLENFIKKGYKEEKKIKDASGCEWVIMKHSSGKPDNSLFIALPVNCDKQGISEPTLDKIEKDIARFRANTTIVEMKKKSKYGKETFPAGDPEKNMADFNKGFAGGATGASGDTGMGVEAGGGEACCLEQLLENNNSKLTIAEVKDLALDKYEEGGDVIIECWDDDDIQEWIDEDGTKEGLFKLFNIWADKYADQKGFEY